jgi:alanyl-tRNA synthetase
MKGSGEFEVSAEVRAHTALHVLKGALAKVLGIKWTTSVYVNGSHGRLTVQFHRKPTDNEIEDVEKNSNLKIIENIPIEVLEMDRNEAEERWGNAIYDLFPISESIRILNIFHLPKWNVNACNKVHTRNTGEIGRLKIAKTRFRTKKHLLEISYDVE